MRLGLLGPSNGDRAALTRAARHAFEVLKADRVIYLGLDGVLDELVRAWARELVGGDPSEGALFERATRACLEADAGAVDAFLHQEQARRELKRFESLPGEKTRVIELLGGKVVVMIYDKASLDEEDILPASFLVFGKGTGALVKQVGKRWFLSPGPFGAGGLMLLDDEGEAITVTQYGPDCEVTVAQRLAAGGRARLRVAGEG